MKTVAILGSTGSLGTQTLEVLRSYRQHFKVVGLLAKQNADLLASQAEEWKCESSMQPHFYEADIIVNVIPGLAGVEYSKRALENNSTLLLGNKESLVADGDELMKIPTGRIIPLDSEHNAIYEILQNYPDQKIEKLILTASGGPFWNMKKEEIENMSAQQALKHPKWQMGDKVTIESATFINKAFEVIEAQHLFNIPLEQIEVLVHPACLVHSMVKFHGIDQPIAYISEPDMKQHIENALLRAISIAPKREIRPLKTDEFQFFLPDHQRFPAFNIVLQNCSISPQQFLAQEENALASFLKAEVNCGDFIENLAVEE